MPPHEYEGPLTSTQHAAADYQHRLGWPVHASAREVWISLPAHLAAIVIPSVDAAKVLDALARPGPVIADPGNPSCWVFLIDATRPTDYDTLATLPQQPITVVGYGGMVDLPPTRRENGALSWVVPPEARPRLPTFVDLITALQQAR